MGEDNLSSPGPCDVRDAVGAVTSQLPLFTCQMMRFLQFLTRRWRDSANSADIETYILRMPIFSPAEICKSQGEINIWLLRGAVIATSLPKVRIQQADFKVKITEN